MVSKKRKVLLIILPVSLLLIWGAISLQHKAKQAGLDHGLFVAIGTDDTATALKLLEQGANADGHDPGNHYNLDRPVPRLISKLRRLVDGEHEQQDDTSALLYLCMCARPTFDPVTPAGTGPDLTLARSLIKHGARANASSAYCSSLGIAVTFQNLDLAKLLIECGAEVNIRDQNGATPVFDAAKVGSIPALLLLKAHGANLDPHDSDGATPLMNAAASGKPEAVAFLLENGAAVNAASTDGNTPILQAARNNHFEAARILLDHGASPEVRDIKGKTPLTNAAENADMRMVRLLVEHGAKIETRNCTAQTPLIVASLQGKLDVVQYLIGRGANIEAFDDNGDTPLTWATFNGQNSVARFLLDHHANWRHTDKHGMNALTIVDKNGADWQSTIQLLATYGIK